MGRKEKIAGCCRTFAQSAAQGVAALVVATSQQCIRIFPQPQAKARYRRKGCKTFKTRELFLERFHHPLDQRVPKAHTPQAHLGVADRIKNSGGGLFKVCGISGLVQQWRDAVGNGTLQRDFNKNERLGWQAWVKKPIAAPV